MKTCPLCSSSDVTLLTNEVRFGNTADIMRCGGCSLVYLDQASVSFPKDFYEHQYHQTYLTHVDPDILDPQKYYEKMQKVSAPWIERVRNMLQGHEHVLDVGCSTGHLITGIQDKAHKVYGHELSRKEVEFCKNVLKIDVDSIPLAERFEKESMDIITLIFVFEHIGDPIPFLEELKSYLKPDGKLVIVVPNIMDALVSLYDIEEFKKFYYCIEHLYYYAPQTLLQTLEKAGFTGEAHAVQEYPLTNHLNWIYRKKPSETLAARADMPNIGLLDARMESVLGDFWEGVNRDYHDRLLQGGFSDRIWCVAEKKA